MAQTPSKTMIPTNTIIVRRDGKNVHAVPGKPFAFTSDEITEIRSHSPDALRAPTNETPVPIEDETETDTGTDDPAKAAKAPRGKAKAPVTEDDEAL